MRYLIRRIAPSIANLIVDIISAVILYGIMNRKKKDKQDGKNKTVRMPVLQETMPTKG